MSAGTRLTLGRALEIVERVVADLEPTVAEIKCVGSVRRRRPDVGDIELLARPLVDVDLFGAQAPRLDILRASLMEMGAWVKGGDRMMQITDLHGVKGLNLDLFICTPPAAWGSLLAIRTGPAALGQYVVTKMRRFRYRHVDGHALDTSQHPPTLVPTDTEEQFFALAQVPCVPPPERDALMERLANEPW